MRAYTGRKHFGTPPLFAPSEGVTVREPLGRGRGWWAGAPSAVYDDEAGRFYLYYRYRKPRELGRGVQGRIAVSEDGLRFEDVSCITKEELGSPSLEKACLVKTLDGPLRLYISFVGADNKWRIEMLEADQPSELDPARKVQVLTPEDIGAEGVKDPVVLNVGGLWHMLVSYAPSPREATPDLQGRMHATGDVYNTGITKSHTGLAVSEDGLRWRWEGDILSPPEQGWDAYCTRIGSVVCLPPVFVGFYDGAATVEENYEEQTGLAVSFNLRNWRRVTTSGPIVASPYGCIRYVEALQREGDIFYYYEYTRADGSHELRANRVPL